MKKNSLLLLVVLVIGLLIGLLMDGLPQVAQAVAAPTATPAPAPRPEPPQIETWGIPDPPGGEPAGCAGQPGCGVMCYYIGENATENQYELSCVAWVFE